MKSRVYLDLTKTPYTTIYKGFIYYFSSKMYRDKFINNVEEYVKSECLKINSKYKININLELYIAISFYKKIEKRGFRVYDDITKNEVKETILFSNNIIYYK